MGPIFGAEFQPRSDTNYVVKFSSQKIVTKKKQTLVKSLPTKYKKQNKT